MGTLAIIGTPIGNLEDITLRALSVLKEADLILCEDTRTTKKLLDRHGISGKKLASYHSHSSSFALDALRDGKYIALVSDAGTPGISDPGMLLVRQVRDKLGDGVKIVAVPGPSALVSALSISGISAASFVFHGFIPHKKGRETLFKEIAADPRAHVAYESSHRILKTLTALGTVLQKGRKVSLARELTKIHEEVLEGEPSQLEELLTKVPVKQKGEFVLIVAPYSASRV